MVDPTKNNVKPLLEDLSSRDSFLDESSLHENRKRSGSDSK